MCAFQISCESTVDLPYEYVAGRDLAVLFYSYNVDGVEYDDDMGRTEGAIPAFYAQLAAGKLPKTSQLNIQQYLDFFEPMVKSGDLLHIAFGSGMTASVRNAALAAETLREQYPARKIVVIDSLCSSSGYGMLVDYAADLRDAGRSLDETADWIMAHRQRVHHQFFSTDLQYYRRSGRMSGATAAIGTILNICPIMRLDDKGHILAYSKVRGKKTAVAETVRVMLEHAENGADYDGKCFICHSNCSAEAAQLRAAVEEAFPNVAGHIRICDIGPIIASHCGPGTAAVFFLGDARAPE